MHLIMSGRRAALCATALRGAATAACIFINPGAAAAAEGRTITGNTPAITARAQKTGAVNGTDTLTVTLWLRPRARAQLDALADDLYNPASPHFRHWLKNADIVRDFAPTEADIAAVEAYAAQHGLTVQAEGPDRFYVRATGSAATVEKAFRVTLSQYTAGGRTFRANDSDPYIEGPAGDLVQAVSGLDDAASPAIATAPPAKFTVQSGGWEARGSGATAKPPTGFSSVCFLPPATKTYATQSGFPKGAYTGNVYQTAKAGCGYTPADIVKAYNLDQLYAQGLNGAGQTIAIIEACGTPTIAQDVAAFSAALGLPPLTDANFTVTNYPGPSSCSGINATLTADVEWIHALAPGANIMLVIAPSRNVDDFEAALFHAISSGVPQVIAADYWTPELSVGAAEAQKTNLIAEIAAVSGMSLNFPSGNHGHYDYDMIFPPEASFPADLPFGTAVGGISLALDQDGSIAFQTAWATHISNLVIGGTILNPPQEPQGVGLFGFEGASGGGQSLLFPKPRFQAALKGKARSVPDIAWLADYKTGGLVLLTQDGAYPPQIWLATGGTELANAMFSAVWAIAGQAAGTPLGQAANTLYHLPANFLVDIGPKSSPANVKAQVQTSSTTSLHFTPAQIFAQPNSHFGPFYSAMDIEPGGNANAVSFGQDYFQHPAAGWDILTGLGVLDAASFVPTLLPSTPGAR